MATNFGRYAFSAASTLLCFSLSPSLPLSLLDSICSSDVVSLPRISSLPSKFKLCFLSLPVWSFAIYYVSYIKISLILFS